MRAMRRSRQPRVVYRAGKTRCLPAEARSSVGFLRMAAVRGVLIAATCALLVAPPATALAAFPGVAPDALFRTPLNAAFCGVGPASLADASPELFCWTPNDGWGLHLRPSASRAFAYYYDEDPRIVHGIRNLKGFAPRARLLRFGQGVLIRCVSVANLDTCGIGEAGPVVFRCSSGRKGLTCVNRRGHGALIGRFRGYRLF
jgi:hypothetical protein